jgi:hypothetical protein
VVLSVYHFILVAWTREPLWGGIAGLHGSVLGLFNSALP